MALTVNDGTAKWQAIKLSEADTLDGLTATQIQNNAISSSLVVVSGFKGTVKSNRNSTVQIPIPSGFSTDNCMFIIENGSAVGWSNLNPNTGLVSGLDTANYSLDYLIIAVKQ